VAQLFWGYAVFLFTLPRIPSGPRHASGHPWPDCRKGLTAILDTRTAALGLGCREVLHGGRTGCLPGGPRQVGRVTTPGFSPVYRRRPADRPPDFSLGLYSRTPPRKAGAEAVVPLATQSALGCVHRRLMDDLRTIVNQTSVNSPLAVAQQRNGLALPPYLKH
jgi:hypothetical protein